MNYYNEHDTKAASWLRELISAGLIPAGHVDERSICDVQSGDLAGFTQCHFFAGIGGWSRALQLAGWPAERPVWTGSCPCQPFSVAGQRKGVEDERHLWPVLFKLIKACRPELVIGEQVASTDVIGSQFEAAFVDAVQSGDFALANRIANQLVKSPALHFQPHWLDGIFSDLESTFYTCAATDLPAAGIGAPHIRQRLYWVARRVANAQGEQHDRRERNGNATRCSGFADSGSNDNWGWLAHSEQPGLEGHTRHEHDRNEPGRDGADAAGPVAQGGAVGGVGIPNGTGSQPGQPAAEAAGHGSAAESDGGPNFWSAFDLIPCRDGKTRRIEPGTFPLVNGLPAGMVPSSDPSLSEVQATPEGRVMRLKGYGNAIVPQVAAEFVKAFLEI